MKTQDIFHAFPKTTEQVNALKAFMKALKIKFDTSKVDDSPYNPEFVDKIQKSRQDYKDGKGISVTIDELNDLWK